MFLLTSCGGMTSGDPEVYFAKTGSLVTPSAGLLGDYAAVIETRVLADFDRRGLETAIVDFHKKATPGATSNAGKEARILEEAKNIYLEASWGALRDTEHFYPKDEVCVMFISYGFWKCLQLVGRYVYEMNGNFEQYQLENGEIGHSAVWVEEEGNKYLVDSSGKKVYSGDTVKISASFLEKDPAEPKGPVVRLCTKKGGFFVEGSYDPSNFKDRQFQSSSILEFGMGGNCDVVGKANFQPPAGLDRYVWDRLSESEFYIQLNKLELLSIDVICAGEDCTLKALGLGG